MDEQSVVGSIGSSSTFSTEAARAGNAALKRRGEPWGFKKIDVGRTYHRRTNRESG